MFVTVWGFSVLCHSFEEYGSRVFLLNHFYLHQAFYGVKTSFYLSNMKDW